MQVVLWLKSLEDEVQRLSAERVARTSPCGSRGEAPLIDRGEAPPINRGDGRAVTTIHRQVRHRIRKPGAIPGFMNLGEDRGDREIEARARSLLTRQDLSVEGTPFARERVAASASKCDIVNGLLLPKPLWVRLLLCASWLSSPGAPSLS